MHKIIVSLTSYPKRINVVNQVIKSLWKQSVCADEIILYLSQMEFPQREKNLPSELVEMVGRNGFIIEWVEDNLKSHKKYYYALQEKRNAVVITVDDDKVYADTLISDLIESYKRFPQAISARVARIIVKDKLKLAEYNDWDDYLDEYTDILRTDLCAIGAGGILYPPLCATKRWFNKENIKMFSENQDDLWLKYNEIIDHIPIVCTPPTQKDIQIEDTKEGSLCVNNMYGGENDISIGKLSVWIKKYYADAYDKWFSELMQKEEYIANKKAFYAKRVKNLFDNMEGIPVYLYGAGKRAKLILKILTDFGITDRLEGIIVSDKRGNPSVLENVIVRQLEEVDRNIAFAVICGVGAFYKKEVDEILKNCNCKYLDLNVQAIVRYYK